MPEHHLAGNTVLLLIEPEPHTGSWNMASDEYMLEAALSDGLKAVRMYRWNAPTVSLGYFQDSNDGALSTTFQNLASVRRLSGGGAILHHHELTYSFVLPADDPLTREPTELYSRVHTAIINVLNQHGVTCAMRGDDKTVPDEPFLCFVRGDRHDIHCKGQKVVGSAQRRRKGAVLQHGSVLIQHSPHASEIPGILDLTDKPHDFWNADQIDDLERQLGFAIAETLGRVERLKGWSDDALHRIAELESSNYLSLDRSR